jgi:hypothetical protein
MMRTAACFHNDFGGGKLFEENHHLCAAEIGLQHSSARVVDAVKGEDSLGRVDANAGNVGHGRLRSWFLTTQFWHLDAVGSSTPTVQYMMSRTGAGGFAERSWTIGTIAQDGNRYR